MANRFAIDKTLTVGELRFHYRDWGGHGWPVLLVHDLAATGHIWDLVAPLLVDRARVFALDLRGHGETAKPLDGYDFASIVQDVRGVSEALELEHPVLIGHGWGAQVGLSLASHFPEEPGGLVMIDGGLIDMRAAPREEMLNRLNPIDNSGLQVERFRELIIEDAPQGLITPAVEAAIMANVEIEGDETVRPRLPREAHMQIVSAYLNESPREHYAKVICPVLIMPTRHRELDDGAYLTLKQKGVESAEAAFADLEVYWLEDCIHDAPLQYPMMIADEVKRFLQERV